MGKPQQAMPALDIVSGITEGLPEGFTEGQPEGFVDSETAADLEHSEGLDSTVPKENAVW